MRYICKQLVRRFAMQDHVELVDADCLSGGGCPPHPARYHPRLLVCEGD